MSEEIKEEEKKVETKKVKKPKKAAIFESSDYVLDEGTEVARITQNRDRKIVIPTYDELEKVNVVFHNLEAPGLMLKNMCFKMWKGVTRRFTFVDGGKYRLPKVLVDHVNKNCQVKRDVYRHDNGMISPTSPIKSETMPDFYKETIVEAKRFLFQEVA